MPQLLIAKPVARLVQGTVMISGADPEREFELLDAVFALGGNTFDTAHVYGNGANERAFGRWVRERGLRDQVVILAKGAHHNADRRRVTPFDISADLYDTLARFQVDAVDLYVSVLGTPDALEGALAWYRANKGLRAALGPIQVPTMYLWGDADHSVSRAAAEGTAEFVAGPYRFVTLPGAGHFSTDEMPDRINALLLEHLAAHPA